MKVNPVTDNHLDPVTDKHLDPVIDKHLDDIHVHVRIINLQKDRNLISEKLHFGEK